MIRWNSSQAIADYEGTVGIDYVHFEFHDRLAHIVQVDFHVRLATDCHSSKINRRGFFQKNETRHQGDVCGLKKCTLTY
jgi:hypothetical protein